VLSNQCTGGPDFQGDQDNDPGNITDCDLGSVQGGNVRAAELQVFAR
jgi:extracellular elastinolytic metalloproteinase